MKPHKIHKTYHGKFKPKNIKKYEGNYSNIVYRSSWERTFFRWCDNNPDVVSWSSEEYVIPYVCKTDNKMHRYFPDVKVKFKNGNIWLIEIKPKAQTAPPAQPKRKSKKYINEVKTYVKNQSKWEAAESFCDNRGWKFVIFTEDTLRKLGMKVI
jgi:hypothetical protein